MLFFKFVERSSSTLRLRGKHLSLVFIPSLPRHGTVIGRYSKTTDLYLNPCITAIGTIRAAGIDNKIILSKSDGIRSVGLYGRWEIVERWKSLRECEIKEEKSIGRGKATKTKKGLRLFFFWTIVGFSFSCKLLLYWHTDILTWALIGLLLLMCHACHEWDSVRVGVSKLLL